MITRVLLISLCMVLIQPTKNAGTYALDCKKIDQNKFKELFKFKFGGGQKGLYLDFEFVTAKDKKFKLENCQFVLKETKLIDGKVSKKQSDPKKIGGLSPCTKYEVLLTITNVITRKDFTYKNFVTTKHDKSSTIDIKVDKVENDSAALSWNFVDPNASCFDKYQVEVKNSHGDVVFEDKNLKEKKLIVSNLTCDDYFVKVSTQTAWDENISSNPKSFKIGSMKIEKLQLSIDEVTEDSVKLSWSIEPQCHQDYQLNLRNSDDGKIVYENLLITNSAVISDLNSCNNYSVELIALSKEKVSLKAVIKSFITKSRPIENVTFTDVTGSSTVTHKKIKISWDVPTSLTCVIDYNFTYGFEDPSAAKELELNASTTLIINKLDSSYAIKNLPLYKRYWLNIYANENTYNVDDVASLAKNWTFNTINYTKFEVRNINEFRLKRTELQLKWNSLDLFVMEFLSHYEVFFEGRVIKTTSPSIVLPIAACNVNYSIDIRCVTKDGFMSRNFTYQTKLNDDEIPLSSLDNRIQYETQGETVIISWTPFEEEEACIEYYEINFNDQTFKVEENKTTINDFAPCMTYEIEVIPVSHKGNNGKSAIFEFTSQEFLPKPPTNLKLINAGHKEMTISAAISDEDKQCNSTKIEFTCNDKKVVVNVVQTLAEYHGKLTGLDPFLTYNCSARVRNSVGSSQSTEVEYFATKQDAPQSPYNTSAIINDDSSIDVTWNADNSTGFASSFIIKVSFETTIYERAKGCSESSYKTKYIDEITETKINLSNLESFSKYSVTIRAKNDYGISDPSKKYYFTTKSAAPSQPRDLKIEFENIDDESLLVVGVVSWSPPCELNGMFSLYTISLNGKRPGFEDHSRTEATSYENFIFDDLKRGFRYEVKVQAKNSEAVGVPVTLSFNAPSGIPLEEDLKKWSPLITSAETTGNVEINLRPGIFLSKIGDITGFAFLVFLANCPDLPQPESGNISSLSNELPATYKMTAGLECAQLYQQTEVLPNKMTHENASSLDEHSLKFTVGVEDCDDLSNEKNYCNGQLPKNERYGVMLRVFTNDGFRDTDPVFIEIAERPLSLLSSKEIVYGSVAGSVLLILIISAITTYGCMKTSKKKKNKLKKKEAAEADENLLSFTSYCVIDKNPQPRKNYDDLL